MWVFIGVIISSILNSIVWNIYFRKAGTLRIDHSNIDKDIYRFEIDNLEALSSRKYIVLKVDNNADLSQK